jgi:hypothetical protein
MTIMNRFFRNKGWLAYGSILGGVIGTLLIHLNEVINGNAQLTFGVQMGLPLAAALGMIGGIFGGVAGSFICGVIAHEGIALNLGEALGVGLIYGFLSGTSTGVLIGLIQRWRPEILSAGPLLVIMTVVIALAILFYARRRGSRHS